MENAAVARTLEVDALRYLERQQPFDGRQEDLPIFIANIEDIIPVLNSYNAAGQTMLINTIKSKLIGRARQVVEIICTLDNMDRNKKYSNYKLQLI